MGQKSNIHTSDLLPFKETFNSLFSLKIIIDWVQEIIIMSLIDEWIIDGSFRKLSQIGFSRYAKDPLPAQRNTWINNTTLIRSYHKLFTQLVSSSLTNY